MNEKNNELNGKIIFESFVKQGQSKFDILLTLASQNLILKKKKGLFKKKYKIVENIFIDDIKVVGDKVKIEQKKKTLKIYTKDKEIEFTCGRVIETIKIMESIIKLKTGSNLLERTSKQVIKVSNIAKKSVKVIGGVAMAVVGTYKVVNDNKEAVIEAVKTVKGFLKK